MYLGWYGTDVNGRYLTSAGKRFSNFRSYSANAAAQSAANTAQANSPAFGNLPNPFN